MIKSIKKFKKKIFKINIYNFLLKIGKQKKKFFKNNFLIKNCLIDTWIKIIVKNNVLYIFGYSNSLLISGIIKIISKIINNNYLNNYNIFSKFNILKIINLNKIISSSKKTSVEIITKYIKNYILKKKQFIFL